MVNKKESRNLENNGAYDGPGCLIVVILVNSWTIFSEDLHIAGYLDWLSDTGLFV